MPVAHLKGTTLHFRDEGTAGEAILFLHAFPLHSAMWAPQLAALKGRFRAIAPDNRGMGKSGQAPLATTMDIIADDAAALLRHLGIGKAIVVGLSMGGYAAFELWRREPGLFRALCLADTKAGADTEEAKANREKFARTAEEKGLSWVADDFVPRLLRPRPDPAVEKEVRDIVATNTVAGVAAAQRGMAKRVDSTATLATITVPTLCIGGTEDQFFPAATVQQLAGGIAGARFLAIPAAGHLPNLEAPAAFNAAIEGFARSLP
jgi:pimeloyl-ACP methyl ester carboxylesterase